MRSGGDTKTWDPLSHIRAGVEVEKEVAPGSSVELAALHLAAACCAQRSKPRKAVATEGHQGL